MITERNDMKHFVAAYNIEAFTPIAEFKSMMDEFLQSLKNTPPAKGQERVLVAGQPEFEIECERLSNGIPLHFEVIQWFKQICKDLNVQYTL